MHLLTFLKMYEPGWFMRLMVLGAQGVFFNGFFIAYLISPRTAHRFVGYLEEEAVLTYTREIADIDAGKLPKWANMEAPDIGKFAPFFIASIFIHFPSRTSPSASFSFYILSRRDWSSHLFSHLSYAFPC